MFAGTKYARGHRRFCGGHRSVLHGGRGASQGHAAGAGVVAHVLSRPGNGGRMDQAATVHWQCCVN